MIDARYARRRLTQRCVIVNDTPGDERDEANQPIMTTNRTQERCRVWPEVSTEEGSSAQVATGRLSIVLSSTTVATATSRIEFGGLTYEVDGPVMPWHDRGGCLAFNEARMVRTA